MPARSAARARQITERFWPGSIAGSVERLKTGCVNHHWLTALAEMAEAPSRATAARVPAPLRA